MLGFGVIWWSIATALTPLAASLGLPALLFARACMGVGEGVAMPAMNNLLSRCSFFSWALALQCAQAGTTVLCIAHNLPARQGRAYPSIGLAVSLYGACPPLAF